MMEDTVEVVSVDKLHDAIDGLALAIFEGMRSCYDTTDSTAAQTASSSIAVKYKATVQSVDRLVGIERSEADQLELLSELSCKSEESKSRVLELERALIKMQNNVDQQLQKAASCASD